MVLIIFSNTILNRFSCVSAWETRCLCIYLYFNPVLYLMNMGMHLLDSKQETSTNTHREWTMSVVIWRAFLYKNPSTKFTKVKEKVNVEENFGVSFSGRDVLKPSSQEESMESMAATVRQSFVFQYRQSHEDLKAVLLLSIETTMSSLAANMQMLSRRNSSTSGKKPSQWTYEWWLWQTGTGVVQMVGGNKRTVQSSSEDRTQLIWYQESASCIHRIRDKPMERLGSSKKNEQ